MRMLGTGEAASNKTETMRPARAEGEAMEAVMERPQSSVGEMAVMDRTGDTKVIWDRNNEAEVEAARATFDSLRKKGYMAYSVKGKNGDKGEVIREFDPAAERLILAPPLVGG
jgi:hypothetical protein